MSKSQLSTPIVSPLKRVIHANVNVEIRSDPEQFFNAFCGWKNYNQWSQYNGYSHWLKIEKNGEGSQFILYDKPSNRHFVHYGKVVEVKRGKKFVWRAPFSEWPRALIGTILEIKTKDNKTIAEETLFFDIEPEDISVIRGFMSLPDFDQKTIESFLKSRLEGLDELVKSEKLGDKIEFPFTNKQNIALDWQGRLSAGKWIRILYCDVNLHFDENVETVFNAFSQFFHYSDWTHDIHVGPEWLEIKKDGVGSKFMIWEKPCGLHVLHYGVVTEFERNKKFTWRAQFADWGKFFVGTSFTVKPNPSGGTDAHHVLYFDVPEEYLPMVAGIASLEGYSPKFETNHIYEEAEGLNKILNTKSLKEQVLYFFDSDRMIAKSWPLQEGRPFPEDLLLKLKPDKVMAYKELVN